MNNDTSALKFPEGFLWGVASSAHQFEGDSVNTQWDEFEMAGRIWASELSGRACDWWKNAEMDFDTAQRMGLNSMRISVSWARIEPMEGRFDPEAIERYQQMLSALIERNIRPIICLHHFANPTWFEKKGAFLSPSCVEDFTRFVKFTVTELYELCDTWITFNEPNVYAAEGYLDGNHPPAIHGNFPKYFRVLGNMARCHAAAYHIIHKMQKDPMVSFANHFVIFTHAKDQLFDRLATRLASDAFNNVFFNMLQGQKLPPFCGLNNCTEPLKGTFDFIGINIYGGADVAFDLFKPQMGFIRRIKPTNGRTGDLTPDGTSMFGEIYPQGIKTVVEKLAHFRRPFFILENGVPDRDDRLRPWVIACAAKTIHELQDQRYKIMGYHHWSLVDNFEWAMGYSMKFGLIEMNPDTQERKPRPSASFFSEIAKANMLTPDMVKRYVPEAMEEIFPDGTD
jgi:beta-glucosidase